MKPCATPGCDNPKTIRGRYCNACLSARHRNQQNDTDAALVADRVLLKAWNAQAARVVRESRDVSRWWR